MRYFPDFAGGFSEGSASSFRERPVAIQMRILDPIHVAMGNVTGPHLRSGQGRDAKILEHSELSAKT